MAETTITTTNAMTSEEMLAKIAELEAKNAALEKAAKAKAAKDKSEPVNNDPNRRVRIELFRDGDKYKEPLTVSVNDYTAVIQRGVPVEVPYYVAKHLEEVAAQDKATAAMIGRMTAEWSGKAK